MSAHTFDQGGVVNPNALPGNRNEHITERADSGEIVRDASVLARGDELITRVAEGRVRSRVVSVEGNSRKGVSP